MFLKKKKSFYEEFKDLSQRVKKKNIILVSGNNSFSGNSKYFFLESLNSNLSNTFYVTYYKDVFNQLKSCNLPVILWHDNSSIKELESLLYAKYVFSDFDINPDEKINNKLHYALTYGAKKISTYHGITIKRFEFNKDNFLSSNDNVIFQYISKKHVDYFVSPSREVDFIWSNHFYDPIKTIYMHHPIHNSLKDNHNKAELINVDLEIYNLIKDRFVKNKKSIFYCPTFRPIDSENNNWMDVINFPKLNLILKQKDIILFISFHPGDPNKNNLDIQKTKFSNIKIAQKNTDIYPSLYFSDFLITDYSAIASDYLLLNKPILFYRPDHELNFKTYKNWDNKFYEKIHNTIDDLNSFFDNFENNLENIYKEDYLKKIKELRDRIFTKEKIETKKFDIVKLFNEINN